MPHMPHLKKTETQEGQGIAPALPCRAHRRVGRLGAEPVLADAAVGATDNRAALSQREYPPFVRHRKASVPEP
jgi:hypothetical protein